MSRNPSITALEAEERVTRNRVALYKAKLYATHSASPMVGQQRLTTLERRWQLAADRLRRARERQA